MVERKRKDRVSHIIPCTAPHVFSGSSLHRGVARTGRSWGDIRTQEILGIVPLGAVGQYEAGTGDDLFWKQWGIRDRLYLEFSIEGDLQGSGPPQPIALPVIP